MSLYNLKSAGNDFIITKFDSDLNPVNTYSVSFNGCSCPAGVRPSCRHRQMLPTLIERADSGWFYDFEGKTWCHPLGEPEPATMPEGSPPGLVTSEPDLTTAHQAILGGPKPTAVYNNVPIYEVQELSSPAKALNALSDLVGFDVTDDNARPMRRPKP